MFNFIFKNETKNNLKIGFLSILFLLPVTGCVINTTFSNSSFYHNPKKGKIPKVAYLDMSKIKDYVYQPNVPSRVLFIFPVPTKAVIPIGTYLNNNLLEYFNDIFEKITTESAEADILVQPEISSILCTTNLPVLDVETVITINFQFLTKDVPFSSIITTGRSKASLAQQGGSRNGFSVSIENAVNECIVKLTNEISEIKF